MSLIVLEGIDGSGKTTQAKALRGWLDAEGIPFRALDFPRYHEPSGALVKQYLSGAFGNKPEDVNPYAASAFYAVDRAASYLESWKAPYLAGELFVTDRYTTSNAVHQASKLPRDERPAFFEWLFDFEYNRLGLPAPDMVLLLDMPVSLAGRLINNRRGAGDIHEDDGLYLTRCREAAVQAAELYGWRTVRCADGGAPRPEGDISRDIISAVKAIL
ncbi:MAG: thymidylate kinase [Oscillospiraceae bacterium]|nr:thymidylate kinase [Oscillospiraceae bacterium]